MVSLCWRQKGDREGTEKTKMGLGGHRLVSSFHPFPVRNEPLCCQPLWLPTSPQDWSSPCHHSHEVSITAPILGSLERALPTSPDTRVCAHTHAARTARLLPATSTGDNSLSHFWVSGRHSGSFALLVTDLGSLAAFSKLSHVIPTGGLAEEEGTAMPQAPLQLEPCLPFSSFHSRSGPPHS